MFDGFPQCLVGPVLGVAEGLASISGLAENGTVSHAVDYVLGVQYDRMLRSFRQIEDQSYRLFDVLGGGFQTSAPTVCWMDVRRDHCPDASFSDEHDSEGHGVSHFLPRHGSKPLSIYRRVPIGTSIFDPVFCLTQGLLLELIRLPSVRAGLPPPEQTLLAIPPKRLYRPLREDRSGRPTTGPGKHSVR